MSRLAAYQHRRPLGRPVLIALSSGVTLLSFGTAFAQNVTESATTNSSPTLVSLFLLLVGLIGISIIGLRMIDLPSIMSRGVKSTTMVDDDSLVPDDQQV